MNVSLSLALQRRPPQGWINTTGRRRPTNPQDSRRLFCYYEHRGARERPAKLFASRGVLGQLWPFERMKLCECSLCVSHSRFRRGSSLALCKCGPRLRAPESQPICNKFHSQAACMRHSTGSHRVRVCLCTYNILTAERDLWINFSHATFHFLDIYARRDQKQGEEKLFAAEFDSLSL